MADIKAQREGQAVPPPETTEPAPKPVKRSWRLARAKPDLHCIDQANSTAGASIVR